MLASWYVRLSAANLAANAPDKQRVQRSNPYYANNYCLDLDLPLDRPGV